MENCRNLKHKLVENSEVLEQKIMENSRNLNLEQKPVEILEQQLMDNSEKVDERFENMGQKVIENSRILEKKLVENSENMEQKMENRDISIIKLREEKKEEMENKFIALNVGQNDGQLEESRERIEIQSETELAKIRMEPLQFDGKISSANYTLRFEAATRANE